MATKRKTERESGAEPERAEVDRLRAQVAELEARVARRGDALGNVQLLTRTFVSLNLEDPREISDTVNSLVTACLGSRCGFMLLREGEELKLGGSQGLEEPAAVTTPAAKAIWERAMAERGVVRLSAAELDRSWPSRPQGLSGGAVCASVEIRERALGLMVMAGKASGEELSREDLEFLSTAAGTAAMAFANARTRASQQELIRTIEEQAAAAKRDVEDKLAAMAALDEKLAIIERQRSELHQLSTPALRLWDGVLAMPIIGALDSRRGTEVLERLMKEIPAQKCHYVILDITGVDVVDTWTANHVMKAVGAARILGARCIVTGIRPAVAQSLVQLGIDLSSVTTATTLQDALRECLRLIEEKKAAKARAPAGR